MNKLRIIIVISLILFISGFIVSGSAFADKHTNNKTEINVDAVQVQTWINGDIESREEEIRAWVNSREAQDATELREEAVNFLNDIENKREEAKSELSGDEVEISENLKIVGYDFDKENGTTTIVLESEETVPVSIKDIGNSFGSGGEVNKYSVEQRTITGVEKIEVNSKTVKTQNYEGFMVDVFDGSTGKGVTIKDREETSGFFQNPDGYMVAVSGFAGALTLAGLSIWRIRNKENEGKDEFIPLT
jgi:hypothetical protein